ncbi:MAG: methyltransferase domain-containing protein [Rivularia sp. (in: Bacteria)]|nr:methyltransferase domain-containing protein [Rivularia sp. MS3]
MVTNHVHSQQKNSEKVEFRERNHCIGCNSSNLIPLWQGKFSEEPTRSFIKRYHYSEDVVKLLGEEIFSLVRCENCGMTFHQRILSEKFLNLLYSTWINDVQIKKLEAEVRTISKIERLLQIRKQSLKHLLRLHQHRKQFASEEFRILDYGCGDGYFLVLAQLLGFDTYGIDFSSTRKQRAAQMGLNIFSSLENLKSQQAAKMHCVTLFQVLEHLDNPLLVLRKIVNIIEEGGILIVEVPNCKGITQPQNFSDFNNVNPLEHINTFTPATLKKICSQAGFVSMKRIPAHVTTRFIDVIRTEISRFVQPSSTSMYFRLCKSH